MAGKFAKILGALGLGSDKEAVTEAHLEAADTKIGQLEQAVTTAEETLATVQGQLTTAQADLKTAKDNLTQAGTDLKTEQDKVATLEEWKKNQAATDGREEDDSNNLDNEQPEAKASWEVAAASAIASVKKRVGGK